MIMTRIISKFMAMLGMVAFMSACADQNIGTKEAIGTLGGAALGGLAGASIGGHGDGRGVGIVLGTLVGGVIGNQIGSGLDKTDRLTAERNAQHALETSRSGVRSSWSNPDNGNSGYVIPKPAYQAGNGNTCREYQQTITVAGRSQQAYGTACRQPDGTWRIQS